MSESVNIRLSVSGAAQAQADVQRVGQALGDMPQRMGAGVSSISTQIGRLRDLWLGLQGLQLFGVGLRELAQMADGFTSLNARLALVTGGTSQASAQFGRLLDIANRMQQPVQEVGQLYIGLARSADNLGASQKDMTRFTEGVAASLRLSGTSSQAAAGALLQLSQMMAGTTVQAQEFNSLIDGAPELLRVVAANLDGTGVSMGELRRRVLDGKLGTKDFFDAFLAGSDKLSAVAQQMPPTIGGALTEISNNALRLVGSLDREMGGISTSIARGLKAVADVLPSLVDPLAKFLDLAVKVGPAVLGYMAAMKAAPVIVGAFAAAKTALTGAIVRYQLAAAIAGSHTAALTGMLAAANAGTLTLTGSVGKLQLAFGVLAAAFAGWQIGTWLRENFVEAQLAGIAFVNGTQTGWELLKLGAGKAWAYIGAAWRTTLEGMGGALGWFLDKLSVGLKALGLDVAANKLRGWAADVVKSTRNTESLSDELARLDAEYGAAKKQIDEITDSMADEAIASFAAKKAHAEQEGQIKKLAAGKGKLTGEQSKLIDSYRKELDKLREANATFGLGEDAVLAYRASKEGLSRATHQLREAIAAERAELERKTEVDKAAKELAEALTKQRVESIAATLDESKSIAEQVRKLQEETAQIGLSKAELRELERARLAESLATAEQRLQTALAAGVRGEELDGISMMVEELRELKRAKEEGWAKEAAIEARDAAKETAEEWAKTVESVQGGLTDALMHAFESGKGFMDAFRDTLVNAFKTLVLQPTIRAIMAPVTGAVGSLLGGPAAASTGGAAGGGTGILGMLGGFTGSVDAGATALLNGGWGSVSGAMSQYTGAGMYGTGAGVGLGALGAAGAGFMGGRAIGGAISNGYAAWGSGNGAVNIGAAIGAIWGPIGSVVGGAIGGMVNRAFGRKLKDEGIEGKLSAEGIAGNQYQYYKGGWFRNDKTKRQALDEDFESAMDAGVGAVAATVRSYVDVLGLPVAAMEQFSQSIKVSFNGLSDEEIKTKITEIVGGFADGLAGVYAGALAQYQASGETALQTLERLSALQALSESLNQFGGVFSSIAALGIDARESLVGMAGGIEALLGKTQQFVELYYSREEQAALSARGISQSLAAAGIDAAGLSTREQFRALVESRDLASEAGREQLVALLDMSAQFAQVADYLGDSGGTLQDLAALAPAMAELPALFADQQTEQLIGLDLVSDRVQAMGDQVAGAVAQLQAVTEAGLAAVAAASAATARQLQAWDDGGAMVVMEGA
ncbi:MAG: tape measure protein [Burkholderiales bacterium]|nr:tape measure protein [Burkholderiales bacterium]